MMNSESEERLQQLEAELAACDSAEEQKVLRKCIALLQNCLDRAQHVERTHPPSDGEECVTFKTDGKGSISEFRQGGAIEHGSDREFWPSYIHPVIEHMYSEGWPLTTPRAWTVKIEDLKRLLIDSSPLC